MLTLLRRIQALDERLRALVDQEGVSETRTPLATRWPKRKQFLESIAAQLKILLRFMPFSDIAGRDHGRRTDRNCVRSSLFTGLE